MSDLIRKHIGEWVDAWNRFWFLPANPATLCLMRVLVGMMLVYTHLVWTLELTTIFSDEGVFGESYLASISGGSPFYWSHFNWFDSSAWLWGSHFFALLVMVGFTIGLWTRVTSILAFLFVVSYAHRAGGALFGLDQINAFLTLYLAVAPCGRMFSVDSWRRKKKRTTAESDGNPGDRETLANVATRLIQLHLCVVYLFAGLGKLQGASWWDGTAIWGALASYEYQTLDVTFLAHALWLVNIITVVSVFWELSYAFLIWPRLTRPLYLLAAVVLHLGIGICMGMLTFAIIMLIANLAFVSPEVVQQLPKKFGRARASMRETGTGNLPTVGGS